VTVWAGTAPAAQPGGVWFLIFVAAMTAIGGGGGITALFLVVSQRRKNRADTSKAEADGAHAISNAAVGLIKPLEDRIEREQAERRTLQTRLNRADRRIADQSDDLVNLRADNKSLRAVLRQVAAILGSATALSDPAATLLSLQELMADFSHHTAE
jgi:chromosome segregation ATPase